ncbi:hypothetical protein [Pseudoalteromonas rubra]|uniref:Uncharacterized protein n=1 Tax=Pseudoalteromonas rubra TaxID=43658 RepID=A0A0U3HUJ4_9GAMM|nr:hypothetical protein [Pseudoalteromonas rubra]ALU44648.1 hypothetical protein AT705_17895 [Pseudoalteromonas rubra]
MKKLILGCALLMASQAQAAWITVSGKLKDVVVYSSRDTILVTLESVTSDINTTCSNKRTLAVSHSLPTERRNRMYSMLLARQTAGKNVSLTYETTSCESWDANSAVYSRIVRMY